MDTFLQGIRIAARTLRRAPGYAIAVIVMITLAVSAGTMLFSLYKGTLLDPWPYDGGDRLLVFRGDYPVLEHNDYPLWSAADYAELRELDDVFDHVIAGRGRDANIEGSDGAQRVLGAEMTPNAFEMLGVRPLHGRTLDASDARPGAQPVAVIAHGLWQRRFGGDPAAIGQMLPVDGISHVIVGVMPPRFLWWGSELWFPLRVDSGNVNRDERRYVVQARLREGIDPGQANAALDVWARSVEQRHVAEYPEYRDWGARVDLLVNAVVRDVREVLGVLFAAVALLALVAGFNVANLLLARAAERRREFAVRAALGASPRTTARVLLTENLVLASIGGGLGLLAGSLSTGLVAGLIPYGYLPAEANISVDPRVAAFAIGIALLVAILSVLPATAWLRRLRITEALHEARGTGSKATVRLRSLFVVAQLVLATVVISAALAVGGGFRERLAADPGFIVEQAVSMRVSLPRNNYPDRPALRRFMLALQERLEEIPGIDAAGLGTTPPLSDGSMYPLSIQGRSDARLASRHEIVAGDWFGAFGIPLMAGRVFDARDREDTEQVAVINETFARAFLRDRNPLGARLRAGPGGDEERAWLTIVGVVGDTRVGGIDGEVRPLVYQPVAQSLAQPRTATVVLRGSLPPATMIQSVRRIVAAMDSTVPVHDATTFEEIVLASMGGQRLAVWLLGGFALTVLLLAALGVFGVVTYVTHLSRNEFGVRMALGATRRDIAGLIGRRSLSLALAGIGAGVVFAAIALRTLAAVFDTPLPSSTPVLVSAATVLLAIVVAACSRPVWLGTRTDPSRALREE